MNYLLAPLHRHYDLGFGATGNAFRDAADHLDLSPEAKKEELFNGNLPVNFLYRHAIELFLKSAIVIFHRRFKLPYGDAAWDSEPMVAVEGKWKSFNEVHGVLLLWTYVQALFKAHGEWLAKNTQCDWTFDTSLNQDMIMIQQCDPRSTFFRYPTTKHLGKDVNKSAMQEHDADAFKTLLEKSEAGRKVFALVVEDSHKEFVTSYVYDDDIGKELADALRRAAGACYSMHAAMRWELCNGW